jgi:uncharacterized protein
MKIIIDIGHPAHVHYFKNFIKIMKSKNHTIFVSARNRSIIHYLLDKYSITYYDRGKGKNGILGKLLYLFFADFKLLFKSLKFKPDLFLSFGTPYAAHVSFLQKKPHIAFTDTEHAKYGIMSISKFTHTFLTPYCYFKELGEKQIRFNSFIELCYLHSNNYSPQSDIKEILGLHENEKYVLLRFVSWNANHDIGQKGLSYSIKNKIINQLGKYAKVFISSEDKLSPEFEPYQIKIPYEKIHDALYYASLYIGEGATMASECAMLGTPAIYVNSLDAGTLQEQAKYGLIYSFRSTEGVLEKALEIIQDESIKHKHKLLQQKMLADKIDTTAFIVWFIENYPESVKKMKENPDFQNNFK